MTPEIASLIPPFNPSNATQAVKDAVSLIPVDRVVTKLLANSNTFFQPVMTLTSSCWAPTRTIRSSEWQVAVLRTAALLSCPYEQQVNEPLGRFFGFNDDAIHLLRSGDLTNSSHFSDRHRLVSLMIEELVQYDRLLPETIASSNKVFGPEGTIEIIVIHNVYGLVAHVMRSAEVEEDPPIPGVEDTLRKFNEKAIEKEVRQREEDQREQHAEPERLTSPSKKFRARAIVQALSNGGLTNGFSDRVHNGTTNDLNPQLVDKGPPSVSPKFTTALGYESPSIVASAALEFENFDESDSAGDTHVRWLYAPVNPQDLLVVHGKYPIQPTYTTASGRLIPGYDGLAQVVASADSTLPPGTLVIPSTQGIGTWRTQAHLSATSLIPLAGVTKPSPSLAVLRMTYLPAFLLLEKQRLYPSDWIIMNAGTSSIAQAATGIAKSRGIRVALVIRDRPNSFEHTKAVTVLKSAGADIVLTESEMMSDSESKQEALRGKRIMLALDAVFGASGARLLRTLEAGGTFVNYGTLSGGGPAAELPVRSKDLFWNGIKMDKFKSSEQIALLGESRVRDLLQWLATAIDRGEIKGVDLETVAWNSQVLETLKAREDGQRGPKLVFKFDGSVAS